MKKKTPLALALLTLSLQVSSCSLSHNKQFYQISFYSDYEGIHDGAPGEDYLFSDSLDPSKAVLVGKGYVAQNGTNRVARLSSLEKDADGNAISYNEPKQATQEGYHYVFDGWQGFYDDGKPVNLQEINGNCAVFAHFSATIKTYRVSISNVDSTELFSAAVEHGTTLGDALLEKYETKAAAEKDLKDDLVYPLPSEYYQNRSFSGSYEDDAKTKYSFDELFGLVVKEDLSFSAVFDDPVLSSYSVSLYSDSSLSTFEGSETVQYGNAVSGEPALKTFTSDGEVFTFDKWKGVYGDEAPEGVKGTNVDPSHILFNCSLYPVYSSKPVSLTLSFLNADGTANSSATVDYGSSFEKVATPSSIAGLAADEVFTGRWSTKGNDVEGDSWLKDDETLKTDLTLYPVVTKASYQDVANAKGDTITYSYSSENRGYVLSKFVPSSSRSDNLFAEEDLPVLILPKGFSLVGVEKFGDGTTKYASSLKSASFPSSIRYVSSNAFVGNRQLESLSLPGLTKAAPFAFSQLYALSSFAFPQTISSIGSKAFYQDSSLSSITIEMTTGQFEKVSVASDWNSNGTSLIPFTCSLA